MPQSNMNAVINTRKLPSLPLVMGVFTLSIFLSAMLLFSVQPMFTKMTLPLLGGSSNVWNTAMVFFQGTLLGGYIYAHLISTYFHLRTQVGIHLLVLLLGLIFLPLAIASGWTPPANGAQAYWLIALFGVSIGVPFFAVSANAPLLQRWFSYTAHKDAGDPYFLYAASNLGSLLSLGLYPVYFEPVMRLQEQTGLWATGYRGLCLIVLIAGVFAFLRMAPTKSDRSAGMKHGDKITIERRIWWVFLAFIPSSLMLGLTSHMTNNIASVPFLWIIPLALYLLTFIIVFAKNPIFKIKPMRHFYTGAIVLALTVSAFFRLDMFLSVGVGIVTYFLISLMCHARLVDNRPDVSRLTEFYIWMSVGGVMGGIFNALIAPLIFNQVYEYLFVLILAGLAHPYFNFGKPGMLKPVLIVLGGSLLAMCVYGLLGRLSLDTSYSLILALAVFLAGLGMARGAGAKTLIDIGIMACVMITFNKVSQNMVFQDRSFFSVVKVEALEHKLGTTHRFAHGDTIHNYQLRAPDLQTIPLAYYTRGGTFDKALSGKRRVQDAPLNVAMIGLGAGAMACYERAGDDWTYFEIDPVIVKMATNPEIYSYMDKCSIESDIRIGDARLKLNALKEKSQDIIMIDAFSSDSVPSHLLTKEAMKLYRSRLKDDGVLFFHTSNRLSDISSVVMRLAEDSGLKALYMKTLQDKFKDRPYSEFTTPSTGLLIGGHAQLDKIAQQDSEWQTYVPSPNVKLWSDDYTNVIAPIVSHFKGEAYGVDIVRENDLQIVSTE